MEKVLKFVTIGGFIVALVVGVAVIVRLIDEWVGALMGAF